MKLFTIDRDPGAKALPGITHDLELSRDGQQLARARACYVYSKLFHISFIVSAGPDFIEYVSVSSASGPVMV